MKESEEVGEVAINMDDITALIPVERGTVLEKYDNVSGWTCKETIDEILQLLDPVI
jgi:hypothetical protein